ncbi:ParB N-terminal domain-containing protein [Granulicella paludicola]|uniref:ParB N-terminal domain-containing protein n=1 Tax=Granulicella paludicola TaxID=474951 RepID=UPI0021DF679E|nr:ParB/RepB/Spo0J family partition protein [Granulicella paludicola]
MNTAIVNATEYRDLPLAMLAESPTNPRRTFEGDAPKELSEGIRIQGVLSPLLVRPVAEQGFEIVFGARRYRAAQMAEVATVPVRIKRLTDAEAFEAQLVEKPLQEST